MSIFEWVAGGGGIIVLIATLLQIAPIKINPWSKILNIISKSLTADIMSELQVLKTEQQVLEIRLNDLMEISDRREADRHREVILKFNMELTQNILHSREDFIEILTRIDNYEKYCKSHTDYPNNRCTRAIHNIKRVYDERLIKHDFA